MSAVPPEFELSLTPDARLERDGGAVLVAARGFEVRLGSPHPTVAAALDRLAECGATEDALSDQAYCGGGMPALMTLLGAVRALDSAGLLLRRDRGLAAIVHALIPGPCWPGREEAVSAHADTRFRWSMSPRPL